MFSTKALVTGSAIIFSGCFASAAVAGVNNSSSGGGKTYSYAPPAPAEYYTPSDYTKALKDYGNTFSLNTWDRPWNAQYALEERPRNSFPQFTYKVLGGKLQKYQIKAIDEVKLEWSDVSGIVRKGDMLFQRANGAPHAALCTLTHVGMVYNTATGDIYEAQPPGGPSNNEDGVRVRPYTKNFSSQTIWTLKRLTSSNAINERSIADAVDESAAKYTGTPYYPRFLKSQNIVLALKLWFDKEDTTSFNCSKLTYQTYKKFVNLDSNRTRTTVKEWTIQDTTAVFGSPLGGVTPDDIYYSPHLDRDLASRAARNWAQSVTFP